MPAIFYGDVKTVAAGVIFALIVFFFVKCIDSVDPRDYPMLDWLAIPLFCEGDTSPQRPWGLTLPRRTLLCEKNSHIYINDAMAESFITNMVAL